MYVCMYVCIFWKWKLKKNKKIMLTHVQHMQAHHATRLPPSFLACGPHSPLPALVVFRLLTRTQGQRNRRRDVCCRTLLAPRGHLYASLP